MLMGIKIKIQYLQEEKNKQPIRSREKEFLKSMQQFQGKNRLFFAREIDMLC